MNDRYPQSWVIAHQPATLAVSDHRTPIDDWPLARSVKENRSVEVKEASRDNFVIAPKRAGAGTIVHWMFLFALGAVPGVLGLAIGVPWWLSLPIILVGLLAIFLLLRGCLKDERRIRLDRSIGQLAIDRRTGLRREFAVERIYPLESIRAIQLLYNGRHTVTEPQGSPEQQSISHREFFGYELNLVIDDPKAPRLHLFSLTDWQWLRETGQALGDFLGVPVIDKLHHGA